MRKVFIYCIVAILPLCLFANMFRLSYGFSDEIIGVEKIVQFIETFPSDTVDQYRELYSKFSVYMENIKQIDGGGLNNALEILKNYFLIYCNFWVVLADLIYIIIRAVIWAFSFPIFILS